MIFWLIYNQCVRNQGKIVHNHSGILEGFPKGGETGRVTGWSSKKCAGSEKRIEPRKKKRWGLKERVKKDSHNSPSPPSLDRFHQQPGETRYSHSQSAIEGFRLFPFVIQRATLLSHSQLSFHVAQAGLNPTWFRAALAGHTALPAF